jgi:hypothetical protein
MQSEDVPVILFVVSLYGFGIALVYALARAWAQALSTRPQARRARSNPSDRRPVTDVERRRRPEIDGGASS